MQQDKINCWIQSADLSNFDKGIVKLDDALKYYKHHDWDSELSKLKAFEANEIDSCPPGIGFVAESRHILHICPNGDGTVMVHYHYPKLFLGFLWPQQTTETNTNLNEDIIPELLDNFFSGRYEKIKIAI